MSMISMASRSSYVWRLTRVHRTQGAIQLWRRCSTETGRIAAKAPFQVKLEPGKTYFWCRCGLSKKQPFCDSSHKGTQFRLVKFTVEEEVEEAFLCGCKQSSNRPYCNGTHATPGVQNAAM